ncbi:hypothetical protein [Streptomyces sp. Je 1-332]|uniref:hypothetical protein n=1 Tax=Streptomyces sp. Je 1-332 TaxID=3231270 RepID=UPI0034574981
MSDRIPASPGEDGSTPVPRDPPDQQATDEPDAWDLDVGKVAAENDDGDDSGNDSGGDSSSNSGDESSNSNSNGDGESGASTDVPRTDEGGTARRGESRALESHAEKPVPDEPSG